MGEALHTLVELFPVPPDNLRLRQADTCVSDSHLSTMQQPEDGTSQSVATLQPNAMLISQPDITHTSTVVARTKRVSFQLSTPPSSSNPAVIESVIPLPSRMTTRAQAKLSPTLSALKVTVEMDPLHNVELYNQFNKHTWSAATKVHAYMVAAINCETTTEASTTLRRVSHMIH
jgi:hypothetical protein